MDALNTQLDEVKDSQLIAHVHAGVRSLQEAQNDDVRCQLHPEVVLSVLLLCVLFLSFKAYKIPLLKCTEMKTKRRKVTGKGLHLFLKHSLKNCSLISYLYG